MYFPSLHFVYNQTQCFSLLSSPSRQPPDCQLYSPLSIRPSLGLSLCPLVECIHQRCYGFGYGMVRTACPFTIHASGLIDSFGTGSNIFDLCPFSYCLYLDFPFLSRRPSLECSFGILCISVSLLWPFPRTFDLYLCRIVGLPL
jgi:hypothetical protein